MTYAQPTTLKERIVHAARALEVELRAVKSMDEIERIMAAQAITDAAFAQLVPQLHEGMTEREAAHLLDDALFDLGADELAFPTIVGTGANGANPHAVPGDRPFERGQCVVIDFGAKKDGYCSDMTRTVFIGEPTGRMADAWRTMRLANEEAAEAVRPGITGRAVHMVAEQVLIEGGFGECMPHGLGHGVGLDIHEQPVLNRRFDRPLRVGHVITIEPGIYLPGQFGMRLEDMGVVTESGFVKLTAADHEPIVI
ncbi:M24 family metallopeptidase [Adlercreutzia murintestinalis]|uniref:M24 family metallopeptidase n=1 Tax=Adlercreutzia murintestinalis TaxID=2941325 RepID=UPI00203BD700|nr:M24 family metallopeptidase [Adlercreutzia murintestinalis]